MAYLVRIQRQRAQSTTRGWQVRAYWDNPRYVSRFFSAADHGGMRGARASALEAKPEVEREAALRRRSMR